MSPMNEEQVLQAVLTSPTLPTLSPVASKLVSLSSREETTIGEIADLVSKDVSLSTKILKVVNSSFYNFPQKIGTIHQAVSILGTNAVRSLVLSFSFLSIEAASRKDGFNYAAFWEQSLAAAVSARLLMAKVRKSEENLEEVFIAGLLQNVGEMLMARAFPDATPRIRSAMKEQRPQTEVEREIIGVDHCGIGAVVFQSWGFPKNLWEPLLHHHSPAGYKGGDRNMEQLIKVVHLAGQLSEIFSSEKPKELIEGLRTRATAMLRLSEQDINDIYDHVHEQVNSSASYFGLKLETRPIFDILLQANAELSVLNMSYEQMNRELVESKVRLEKLTRDLEEKNRMLEQLANVDGLTEVYNHRYFQDFLEREMARSRRFIRPLSLMLADIDHFKKFNDTYGHQVGDFILKEVCKVVGKALREHDLLARYGGEEFILVLPEIAEEDAVAAAERIRTLVEEHKFKDDRSSYSVTMSLGVATFHPGVQDCKKNELIGLADEALYEAKKKGRNRVQAYAPRSKWFGLVR